MRSFFIYVCMSIYRPSIPYLRPCYNYAFHQSRGFAPQQFPLLTLFSIITFTLLLVYLKCVPICYFFLSEFISVSLSVSYCPSRSAKSYTYVCLLIFLLCLLLCVCFLLVVTFGFIRRWLLSCKSAFLKVGCFVERYGSVRGRQKLHFVFKWLLI